MPPWTMAHENTEANELIRQIAEGTSSVVGDEFFVSVTRQLAKVLKVRHAFVCEHLDTPATRVRTLAFWMGDHTARNVTYDVAGSPCEVTAAGEFTFYPDRIQDLFPADKDLVDLKAESYCGIPLRDRGDRIIGHLAVMDDRRMEVNVCEYPALRIVAMRVSAELERRRSEETMRAMNVALDNAMPGTSRLSQAGRFIEISDAYAAMIGYEPSELIGASWEVTIHPDDLPLARRVYERMLQEERAEEEVRALRKDGSTFYKQIMMLKIASDTGECWGHHCFIRDMSQRRKAAEEKAHLEAELRQAQKLEAVGTLATGIAHDFSNLLTAILGYTDQARDLLPTDHPAIGALEMVERASEQAGSVARSLLTFTHKESGKQSPADLGLVLDDSLRMLRSFLPASIDVVEGPRPAAILWVNADRLQLQQVFMNLAVNARDAMPEGGRLRVDLAAVDGSGEGAPGEAVITVSDTGQGMTDDIRTRVFEPFFTTKARGAGTGLGLSVTHGIIAGHGGRISVASAPGQGTRFTIRLPMCPPPAPTHPLAADDDAKPGDASLVILAEDNTYVRSIVVTSLESAGYRVEVATDGEQVMRVVHDRRHDAGLLLLDLDLPKRSGLSCLEELDEEYEDLPIVVLTGNVDAFLAARRQGREDVLAKPIRMSDLVSTVKRVISKAREADGSDG